jgi:hypothetical protein
MGKISMMYERIKQFAVVLLALTSLYSTVLHWHSTINLDRGAKAIDAWEARLHSVRETLPVKRGIIGFVGDSNVPGIEYNSGDQETEFILTQYTLAPLILVPGTVADWNLAILGKVAFEKWQQSNQGNFEIISLGHQVYLFHKRAQP